ncbi:MAG TPA: phosphodiester glycosidase family protein, partial [Ktedonobacteraceae bacterium]
GRVQLQIGYQPTNPMTMSQWQQSTGAKVLMNGGYFDSNDQPEGLLVSNGQTAGTSYQGFGGMLSVDSQGTISLRSLSEQPYDPNVDQLTQATQSSPMLIIDGKRAQFDANAASQRRSIVATDTQGRLLFIVSPNSAFSLDEIADLLASSDLFIKDALNLDGGASTGLYVSDGTHQKAAVDSATPLPIMIIVK